MGPLGMSQTLQRSWRLAPKLVLWFNVTQHAHVASETGIGKVKSGNEWIEIITSFLTLASDSGKPFPLVLSLQALV